MKTISLKIEDSIFNETEKLVSKLKKSRNRYINEAIDYYNAQQKRRILGDQLERESKLVRKESMAVLREFEKIDYGS
jgi:metal-responsive CopG/Arc/MetJ family transcriptional regulator